MGIVTASVNTNQPVVQQLSNGNGATAGTGGTSLGVSAADLISFFGATPVVQPSGSGQAGVVTGASAYGNASGAVTHYNTVTVSPASVAANTVAEQSLTATGTLATDLVWVNAPGASFPGLGLMGARVSSAGTVALTFANATAGTITPTTNQSYIINTVAANLQLTAALTVAAIAANTVVEQQFTVTGLQPGMAIQVNKPTTNGGIGLASARVVANNTLGLTFINATSGVITPTTNQTYLINGLNQFTAGSNVLLFGLSSAAAPATVAANTSVSALLTEAGITAIDVPIGLSKPSVTPGVVMGTGFVSAATAYRANYVNATATVATPTTAEVYSLSIFRPSVSAPVSMFTATITPTSVAANTAAEQTFTVAGIVSGQPVTVTPQTAVTAGGVTIAGARASATNTIALNFYNATATAFTPAPFAVNVLQFNQTTPSAGNFVQYNVSPLQTVLTTLLSNLRSAMVSLGLVKGA